MQIVEENEFSNAAQAASEGGEHVWTYEESGGFNADLKAARFRLGNGLRALLMVDPRAPVFAYQTWFHVGSKNENPERTGLAHLFEHLMFKGTQTHPAGVFDKEMERRGTQTNAATWVDWTYYTQSLAARGDNLEALMGFESDRMQNLLLDDETFTSEMEVVKNERRMVVDNSVSGTLNEALFETAYKEHSYRWPTIGKMEHLEETTLEDARDFYQAHYTPNNATVVIVGDINLVQTLKLLAKYYGAIPARSPQKSVIKEEPVQTEERRVVIQRPMAATQVVMAFHVPDQRHDDYAPLEFL
ncbi:insulinase family protein, partial [Myxococcota bacterium]|nr:insulinase family protein [Myxococcota bacterium]